MRERIAPRAYPGRVPPWPSQLSLDTQAEGLTAEDTQAEGLTFEKGQADYLTADDIQAGGLTVEGNLVVNSLTSTGE